MMGQKFRLLGTGPVLAATFAGIFTGTFNGVAEAQILEQQMGVVAISAKNVCRYIYSPLTFSAEVATTTGKTHLEIITSKRLTNADEVALRINNNTAADVLTVNNDGTVSVLTDYNGVGFVSSTNLSFASAARRVLAADIDSDGDTDLVTLHSASIGISLNNGAGAFAAPIYYTGASATQDLRYLALGDFYPGGAIDVAATDGTIGITIWQNDGAGRFARTTGFAAPFFQYNPLSLNAADINNDGKTDLVVTNTALALLSTTSLGIMRNIGSASAPGFDYDASYNFAYSSSRDTVLTDYNRDGRTDIIATNDNRSIMRLQNNNNVSFSIQAGLSTGATVAAVALARGDFDLDGYIDVISANSTANNLSLFVNNRAGSFAAPTLLPVSAAREIAHFDYDNDGDLDLIFPRATGIGVKTNNRVSRDCL